MALVDTTIVVDPSNVVVSTDAAQTVSVSSVVAEITVSGAAGIRGPQGPQGEPGPSGIDAEVDTNFVLIYQLAK